MTPGIRSPALAMLPIPSTDTADAGRASLADAARRRVGLRALWAGCLALGLPGARSQASYPSRPIRLVLPVGPGSGTDTFLRAIAVPLAAALGQPVVVENRAGAMMSLAIDNVAKSPPDGYSVIAATNAFVANPAGMLRSVGYDPFRDLTPISRLGSTTYVLVVAASQPWQTVGDLIAHARANPGKLNYASGNLGGIIYMGLLEQFAGLDMVQVPYKSTPPALLDLLGGQVQMMFTDISTAMAQVRAGKLRPLLATALTRTAQFPDTPTFAEAGFRGVTDMPAWWGLYGPAGLPADVVTRLNREVNLALQRPEVRTGMQQIGIDVAGSTPEQLATFTREQFQNYSRLIKEFGIQPE